jgi:putative ABC transport system permease protein
VVASRYRSARWTLWRRVMAAQCRERPGQLLLTALSIALGVALGMAVYLVNAAAFSEFSAASRRLAGTADVVVRGPAAGFDESLFTRLAQDPAVASASPMLELQLALARRGPSLKLLGIDAFRAAAVQPTLMAQLGGVIMPLLDRDAVVLSAAAAGSLRAQRGQTLQVLIGSETRTLRIIAVLPAAAEREPYAVMDIASAQWTLDQLGRLNRIDLRLRAGADATRFRQQLELRLPPGVLALAPDAELERAASATRAYRVNLNMLALVALLTGGFLILSTQWLSVLRRRTQLALLRALGVTRGELQQALLFEGAAIGAVGSLLGVCLGFGTANLVLRYLGDGASSLSGFEMLSAAALPMLCFVLLGTFISGMGAWLPAREAARRSPAQALRAGDAESAVQSLSATLPGVALIVAGAGLAWLPPVAGLPILGYAAVATLLFGSVLIAPTLVRRIVAMLPRTGFVAPDTSLRQLQGSVGIATVGLAAIIVSFSLMVAMAIMVHSFRDSFESWLGQMLPADLQLRPPGSSDTAALSVADQRWIAALPGVARASFQRRQQILIRADRPAVTLIARDESSGALRDTLPLVGATVNDVPGLPTIWISEAVQDFYDLHAGDRFDVPIGSRLQSCVVGGVWRDYTRPGGAIAIGRQYYQSVSGDGLATEGSLWLQPGAQPGAVEASLRQRFMARALEIASTPALRERSLLLFDRAFAITNALELIAVLIGLVGVGVAASGNALARRAQFGVLRHLGFLRRQVLGMLASEGLALCALAVGYGLVLGGALSLVLVYVINRQSFNWSIDLTIPWWQLAALSAMLIAAATATAIWSGRSAMSGDAVRAVREDW